MGACPVWAMPPSTRTATHRLVQYGVPGPAGPRGPSAQHPAGVATINARVPAPAQRPPQVKISVSACTRRRHYVPHRPAQKDGPCGLSGVSVARMELKAGAGTVRSLSQGPERVLVTAARAGPVPITRFLSSCLLPAWRMPLAVEGSISSTWWPLVSPAFWALGSSPWQCTCFASTASASLRSPHSSILPLLTTCTTREGAPPRMRSTHPWSSRP